MTPSWLSLAGGLLIGAAAVLLLLVNGRIAGISGIIGALLGGRHAAVNVAFVAGLVAGPILHAAVYGRFPPSTMVSSWPGLLIAGLLVGIGTRLGSGCTSGHGVLGLARQSRRSFAATAVFLTAGMVTATVLGGLR